MDSHRKKVLYVITKSNFGGAQRYVFELATHLHQNGHEVHVACGGSGVLTQKLSEAGITVHTIKNFERDINLKKELGALRELYALIRTLKPDVVHLNSSKAGGSGAFIARMCRVPKIVFTAHGWPFFEDRNFFARSVIWFLSYLTVLLAHKTIVVSVHDHTYAHLPFLHKKLTYIRTAVPHITFLPREVSRGKLFTSTQIHEHVDDLWIVSTSEHTPNKNLLFLIRAVHAYNETHTQKIFLTLIGTGELKTTLETEAAHLNLTHSVSFLGYVEDARTYLRAFDVFVLPSVKEGLPYGLLEAGLAGLHTIASAVGGIPEVLSSSTLGVLIDPKSPDSLISAFEETAARARKQRENKDLCAKITQAYMLDDMLEHTTALYNT